MNDNSAKSTASTPSTSSTKSTRSTRPTPPAGPDILDFAICGQTFRLRATEDDARRIRKVAAEVERQIHECRRHGANSDLRAALMVAYELAFDLDRAAEKTGGPRHERETDLAPADEIADRLIERIDKMLNQEGKEIDPKKR